MMSGNIMKVTFAVVWIFYTLILTLLSCGTDKTNHAGASKNVVIINDFNWLVGTWKRETSKGMLFESWKMVDDSLLSGFSYGVTGSDTTLLETLSIENIKGDFFYIPVVEDNQGPVFFRLTEFDKNRYVFENPDHDYPQRIIYRKLGSDSLNARIEGTDEGKFQAVDFYFRKSH
jgi:hypothetical protein